MLQVYLLVTTRLREGEAEADPKLYREIKETPFFDETSVNKFKSNMEFRQNNCATMETDNIKLINCGNDFYPHLFDTICKELEAGESVAV